MKYFKINTNTCIKIYLGTIKTCSVVGSGIGFYNQYKDTRMCDKYDRISNVTLGTLYGYGCGFIIGLTSPIWVTIGLSIETIKTIENLGKK